MFPDILSFLPSSCGRGGIEEGAIPREDGVEAACEWHAGEQTGQAPHAKVLKAPNRRSILIHSVSTLLTLKTKLEPLIFSSLLEALCGCETKPRGFGFRKRFHLADTKPCTDPQHTRL